jgi:hypothetical protein
MNFCLFFPLVLSYLGETLRKTSLQAVALNVDEFRENRRGEGRVFLIVVNEIKLTRVS